MRLALIAHHVAPIAPPFVGGVESMTWYLSRWLADEGHDVVVFGPPGTEIPGVSVCPLELGPRLSVAARGDVAMPPADFMSAHHAYQQLMVGLGDSRDDFDLVHVNSLHYLPVAMAGLLPYPVILTLHTPPTPWLESALASQRDPALTLTAVSSRTVELWAGIARVDEVVPNGVDLRAWPAGPGGEDAVWTGRMVSEKAPHRAIDAAREAGMALHLAGPIVDAAYWEREIAPRLGSDVHYAGHLDHTQLARLVGHSAVALATPAWEEPFGLSAAEAIATGTPVAAFARGGLPEVIGPAGCLAEPADVSGLAKAIDRAVTIDRAIVRDHARRCLGIEAMGRGYVDLYHQLARDRTVGAASSLT